MIFRKLSEAKMIFTYKRVDFSIGERKTNRSHLNPDGWRSAAFPGGHSSFYWSKTNEHDSATFRSVIVSRVLD